MIKLFLLQHQGRKGGIIISTSENGAGEKVLMIKFIFQQYYMVRKKVKYFLTLGK